MVDADLFLALAVPINIIPGIVSAILAARFLPRQAADPSELGHLDVLSLLLMATALTSLELSLKEAPTSGWTSAYVLGLLALCLASGGRS